MKAFTIDTENNIVAWKSFTAAKESGAESIFTNATELANLVESSGKRLVEIWNSIPGVTPVKKFTSTKVAVERIWKAIQSLGEPAAETETAAAEPKQAKSETKKPRAKAAKPAKEKKARGPKAEAGTGAPREGSKVAQVIEMLKRKKGATLEQLCEAMGWQQHTTRALTSAGGAIYKKFGLVVTSEAVDGVRTYRIAA